MLPRRTPCAASRNETDGGERIGWPMAQFLMTMLLKPDDVGVWKAVGFQPTTEALALRRGWVTI